MGRHLRLSRSADRLATRNAEHPSVEESGIVVARSMVQGTLLDDAGGVLLMRTAFPWFERPVWIAPGGGLQDGEPSVEGLRRELEEETGQRDLLLTRLVADLGGRAAEK